MRKLYCTKGILHIATMCFVFNGSLHGLSWSDFKIPTYQSMVTYLYPKSVPQKIIASIVAVSSLSFCAYKLFTAWQNLKKTKSDVFKDFKKDENSSGSCRDNKIDDEDKKSPLCPDPAESSSLVVSLQEHVSSAQLQDYVQWKEKCKQLPSNIQTLPAQFKHAALDWKTFESELEEFFTINKKWYLEKSNAWIRQAPQNDDVFFNVENSLFKPFVQKLLVPSGTILAIRGDLHGDIHSLLAYLDFLQQQGFLQGFKIIKKNFIMLFLGDYVDRGNYGAEVLYTLMRLKNANPDQVTLVRGNHEDQGINQTSFMLECRTKFAQCEPSASAGASSSSAQQIAASLGVACAKPIDERLAQERFKKITRLYDFLPVACYVGSGTNKYKDFMQCCHGGMEIGFDPVELLNHPSDLSFSWVQTLNQLSEYNALDYKPKNDWAVQQLKNLRPYSCQDIGFMWNDFAVNDEDEFTYNRSRGFTYNKAMTQAVLKRASRTGHKVRGVLRAHQHDCKLTAMMSSIIDPENKTSHKGLSKLWKNNVQEAKQDVWDGIVCTFLVAPDSVYSQKGALFDFDAFALMTTGDTYEQWKLKVHRNMLKEILPPVSKL